MTSVRVGAPVLGMALLVASVAAGAQAPAGQAVDEKPAAAMMAQRHEMMAAMAAADQKLADLLAKFEAARDDDAKIVALGEVVKALAAQRGAMRERMTGMEQRMMAHMMSHMAMAAKPDAMMNCPMMKEVAKPPSESDHSEHQPGR